MIDPASGLLEDEASFVAHLKAPTYDARQPLADNLVPNAASYIDEVEYLKLVEDYFKKTLKRNERINTELDFLATYHPLLAGVSKYVVGNGRQAFYGYRHLYKYRRK